ncbi:MAG: branched-chain amino acid ABC transporter permease [Desulfobacteraceae bacterium]|jgi:branched-chain amino acid transport system permease protein|nr:branched-chain amino acid ABC transporter permease [Desulfobacteraceae bacterium]
MEQIIQMIINGGVLGSNLVMVAMGFSMLIGIMRLIQFAHGSMYMLGGYGVWYISVQLGLNYWLALVFSIVIVTVFGIILERYFLRQFRETLLPAVVVTVAWMMILETGVLLVFGTESKSIPTVFAGTFNVKGIYLSNERFIVSLISLASIAMIFLFMSRTKDGRAMRAVAREAETATLMGVNLARVFRLSMIIATILAAAAGALMGPIFTMTATVGGSMSFKALVAITLGGMGSIGGAALASYLLGMIESFTGTLVGADFAMLIYFFILILVLLIRPQGFFGFEYKF